MTFNLYFTTKNREFGKMSNLSLDVVMRNARHCLELGDEVTSIIQSDKD